MLPKAAGRGQHFQDLGHSFSLYGPPSRPITYIYSLHPNTNKVKMNTFSLNSVLGKYLVSTPQKIHFPAVLAQDQFCFRDEREL